MANANDIINIALRRAGHKRVDNYATGTNKEHIMAQDLLEEARLDLLTTHTWNFAVQRKALDVNKATVTMTIANPGVVTLKTHNLQDDDPVTFTTTGALPTGISSGTKYFVVSTAANTFQVATTIGGTAIETTGSQSGTHSVTYLPTFGWDGAYVVPPDFLRAISVHPSDNDYSSLPYRLEHMELPVQQDRVILLKTDQRIYLRYVEDLQDYGLMSPPFRDALAWRLARDFGMTIGRPFNFIEFADIKYEAKLTRAKSIDSVEDWPEARAIGSWATARAGTNQPYTNDG